MAVLDTTRRLVVARVIYDGSPEAGKTTNVRQIHDAIATTRRGELHSPGTSGPRTEFFDWLDFQGGYVDGHDLRCQILGVPGQFSLQSRREFLLKSADAVVFVADARPEALEETRSKFATLTEILKGATAAGLPPVPVVVQANKQDAPGAIAPTELAQTLGIDPAIPVMGAKALSGEGVMQSFILAMRLASDRIQVLLGAGAVQNAAADAHDPLALHAAMQKLEALPDAVEASIQEKIQNLRGDAPAQDAPQVPLAAAGLTMPTASDVPAGYLWPTLKARSILGAINAAPSVTHNAVSAAWAPPHAIEFATPNGWILHTADNWVFDNVAHGRDLLLHMVKRCLAMPEWIPEGRTFMMARDQARWRLWMTTPALPSARDMLERALRGAHVPDMIEALRSLQAIHDTIAATSGAITYSELGDPRCTAFQRGHAVCMGVPDLPVAENASIWREKAAATLMSELRAFFQRARDAAPVREAIRRAALQGEVMDLFQQWAPTTIGAPA